MPQSNFDRGMEVRRKVLGDAHVDRSWANTTDFDRDFQRFITETAWGGVWSRTGLDIKTRHLVTIAILAALGREHELKLHVAATPNTEITLSELREVLLHVAAYSGIPAANSAIAIIKNIFPE